MLAGPCLVRRGGLSSSQLRHLIATPNNCFCLSGIQYHRNCCSLAGLSWMILCRRCGQKQKSLIKLGIKRIVIFSFLPQDVLFDIILLCLLATLTLFIERTEIIFPFCSKNL
jgi:hypothetical protein